MERDLFGFIIVVAVVIVFSGYYFCYYWLQLVILLPQLSGVGEEWWFISCLLPQIIQDGPRNAEVVQFSGNPLATSEEWCNPWAIPD